MNPRNIGGSLWTLFKNSFGYFKQKAVVIGKDHLGNTYLEKLADSSRNLKGARWVETADGDQFTAPDIPVEWEAWLRNKRKDPPTEMEIARNHAIMLRTLKRAKEAEEKIKMLSEDSPKAEIKQNQFADINSAVNSNKFPEYPEYEIIPGKRKDEK